MDKDAIRYRDALLKIAEAARSAAGNGHDVHGHKTFKGSGGVVLTCTPRSLPKRLLVEAAKTATTINPVNAPAFAPFGVAADLVQDPLKIAVLTSKYWGPSPRTLTVSFMESAPPDLRAKILEHMNAWTDTACISFVETQGVGQVRISREGSGYWSYLGTDILQIPNNLPTMNLQDFSMGTPDSEDNRVVRHETGHTLGFPHEHMRQDLVARIDRDKAYQYFWDTQRWDKDTVDQQVLTPLDEQSFMGTPADQTSIMCYQLPGEITIDGEPIVGGLDINETDYQFAGKIYPKAGQAIRKVAGAAKRPMQLLEDWDPSEDVRDAAQ